MNAHSHPAAVFLLLFAVGLFAQSPNREQGRSMTMTPYGIVATSQILASQAGADLLSRGGSAIDAAIAANAVLALVEPMMDGIGGDLFATIWDAKTGKLQGLNASGWAPKDLSIEFLKSKGFEKMPSNGIHTVTVPGCVAGWAALHQRYGKLPWKDLFQSAISYARDGFPVTERIATAWSGANAVKLLSKPEAEPRIFLPNGKPPKVGQVFRNPDLARAFTILAEEGPKSFYHGSIAKAILETSKRMHGTMQASDLTEWQTEWVQPISTEYRGWKVYELPPNGQGIGALEMLNLMETTDLSRYPASSTESLHWEIESMRLAYADLWQYVSDPLFVKVPVRPMLSKDYAKRRAAAIDKDHANCRVIPDASLATSGNTTYLAVIDKDGNIASWIQSLAGGWGSGVAVEGLGFMLQNRGMYFRLDSAHANALAPRKRPLHTIIPAFLERGDIHIGFGIMGGPTQPLSHAQFVSNIVDHGMNIQAALDSPRFSSYPDMGCKATIESRVAPEVREALAHQGHVLTVVGPYTTSGVGVGQAVMRNSATHVNYGASDARADGAAVPQGPPKP